MNVKFLHTSDWQLGVTRHFLAAGPQDRWAEARNDAIVALCRMAIDEKCEFIVVAGDVFETNHVSRRTVLTAIEAMKSCRIPIYLLPGNHDCLEPSNVYESQVWREHKPAHVHVIIDSATPIEVRPGVEVAGAPWSSKRPVADTVGEAARRLDPLLGGFRVMVGHGATSNLSPDPNNPALIDVAAARLAIDEKRYHYLALGDRHSMTNVTGDPDGRIWYSGTPEAFDFAEIDNGNVLIVEADHLGVRVTARRTGKWKFVVHEEVLGNDQDLNALSAAISAIPDKHRTLLKLALTGTLTMTQNARLDSLHTDWGEVFAAVFESSSATDLVVIPNDTDFSDLSLSGYGAAALEELRRKQQGSGQDQDTARDALALLMRLQGAVT